MQGQNMDSLEIAKGILDYRKQYPESQHTMESLLRNIRQNIETFGDKKASEKEVLFYLENSITLIDGTVQDIPKLFILKT